MKIATSPSLCRLALCHERPSLINRMYLSLGVGPGQRLKVFSEFFSESVLPGPVCVLVSIPPYIMAAFKCFNFLNSFSHAFS